MSKPQIVDVNVKGIPEEIRAVDRWVCWDYEWKEKEKKWTKVPKYALAADGENPWGSSTNPDRWSSFSEALDAFRAGKFDGVGFVFVDGWVGVDFDSCRDPETGRIAEEWAEEMSRFPEYFWEVSPSGTGIHGIGRGGSWMPKGIHQKPVEIYPRGRFFTVTGIRISCPEEVGECEEALRDLWERYRPLGSEDGSWEFEETPDILRLRDRHLRYFPSEGIVSLMESEEYEFSNLWDGDISGHNDDWSRADLALCNHLTWLCGPDPQRIEDLFSQSGLGNRVKWRDRDDYRKLTIGKSLFQYMTSSLPSELLSMAADDADKARRRIHQEARGGWSISEILEELGAPRNNTAEAIDEWRTRAISSFNKAKIPSEAFTLCESDLLEILEREGIRRREGAKILKLVREKLRIPCAPGTEGFVRTKGGAVAATYISNFRLAMSVTKIDAALNLLTNRVMTEGGKTQLTDEVLSGIRENIETELGVSFSKDIARDAVNLVAEENAVHPVRDYLDRVEKAWDGKPRIDRWLIDYLGAEDSAYTRAIGALMLIAAVRRVRSPGCKYDEMVILEGPQGTLKSMAIETIAGKEWFSDDCPLGAKSREFIEATEGKWIMEVGELASFSKSDVKTLKKVLSRTIDKARMAYGYYSDDRPRQFIIVGSTNEEEYLEDNTGNRRFWPLRVGDIQIADLERDRGQLWGEAATREARGESIRLERGLWPVATREQDARMKHDPWEDVLLKVLGGKEGRIPSTECFKILKMTPDKQSSRDFHRLRVVMEKMGWTRCCVMRGVRGYQKGNDDTLIEFEDRWQEKDRPDYHDDDDVC